MSVVSSSLNPLSPGAWLLQTIIRLTDCFLLLSDDSFVTPPSTPPSDEEDGVSRSVPAETLVSELCAEKVMDTFYEK